jgi:endonuclease YncB( thermonuclease family)
MNVTADKSSRAYVNTLGFVRANGEVDMTGLAESIQESLKGNLQYTGGNSALVRDVATHGATGYMQPGGGRFGLNTDQTEKIMSTVNDVFNSPQSTALSMIPIIGSGLLDIGWDAWTWVRDNLLDQHGCYIQYLTKNGQPMDAGLSFNQGVAVGYHHTVNLLPGILGVEVKTVENGHRRITANDLMSQLGWQEVEVASIQRQVSWWNNYWNSKVLDLSGHGPDPVSLSRPNAYLAEVVEPPVGVGVGPNGITDGDTFWARKLDASGKQVGDYINYRLAAVDTPELVHKVDPIRNDPFDKAYIARQYLEKLLVTNQTSAGLRPIVAIRETGEVTYGRTVAVVFHNGNYEVSSSATERETQRQTSLLRDATAWPLITWDSFMPDGRPYTANWELVITGLAYTDMGGLRKNDPDRGYSPGNFNGGN